MDNKELNKIKNTWDYKGRLKHDGIILMIIALAVFVIYYSKISPTFNRMGFLKIYTSSTMRFLGLFAITLVYSFGDLKLSSIWGNRKGRIVRLLAMVIDLVLTYHIAKLTFIGFAVLGNLTGLL